MSPMTAGSSGRVDRIVRQMLQKLHDEDFEAPSDVIVHVADVADEDARTLLQVIDLIIEKATEDSRLSQTLARLCLKMTEQISSNVWSGMVQDNEGNSVTGSQLLKRCLDQRCHATLEMLWAVLNPAILGQTGDPEENLMENGVAPEVPEIRDEPVDSDESTSRMKWLNLVRFMRELFKLSLLSSDGVDNERIKKPISGNVNSDMPKLVCLVEFLATLGSASESSRAEEYVEHQLSRISTLSESSEILGWLKRELLELVVFRQKYWLRNNDTALEARNLTSQPQDRVPTDEGLLDLMPNPETKDSDLHHDPCYSPQTPKSSSGSNVARNASISSISGDPTSTLRTSHQGDVASSVPQKSQNPKNKKKWGRKRNQVQATIKSAAFSSSQTQIGEDSQITTNNVMSRSISSLQVRGNFHTSALEADEGDGHPHSPWRIICEAKALLNRLSLDGFENTSDQIIAWANKSEKEKDALTLFLITRLIFEKATKDEIRSAMYARLCLKMTEQISQHVSDDEIRDTEGNLVSGGRLFRKFLLNRCQDDFERYWGINESATAAKARDGKTDAKDDTKPKDGKEEVELYSEEYCVAFKARLGLVKFMGELFKLSMLSERVMHECIKRLLSNIDEPDGAETESLCKFLTTVGQRLDTVRAKGHMDIYFSRMAKLSRNDKLTSQVRYMLLDVIQLRHRNWLPKSVISVPPLILGAAEKEQAAQEKELASLPPMSRGSSRREENTGYFLAVFISVCILVFLKFSSKDPA